jgi:hypothetical protein
LSKRGWKSEEFNFAFLLLGKVIRHVQKPFLGKHPIIY